MDMNTLREVPMLRLACCAFHSCADMADRLFGKASSSITAKKAAGQHKDSYRGGAQTSQAKTWSWKHRTAGMGNQDDPIDLGSDDEDDCMSLGSEDDEQEGRY